MTQHSYAINSQYLSRNQIFGITTLDDFPEKEATLKEELTVELSSEILSSVRNEEIARKELTKLRKIYERNLKRMRAEDTDLKDIRVLKMHCDSLKVEIERLERKVVL